MRYILIILVFLSVGAKAQMVIKAHANYRPYAAPVSVNLLLDDYPNAAAAYSLRKLDKDYTGAAIRVRKDTTGQPEQDIFFVGNELDTAALKQFLLNNSGFITTWYSQGDSTSVNFTQTTAANQPRIALNGVIDRRNGKPSAYFDGSRFMDVASSTAKFNFIHRPSFGKSLIAGVVQYGISSNPNATYILLNNNNTQLANNGFATYYADNFGDNDVIYNSVNGGLLGSSQNYYTPNSLRLFTTEFKLDVSNSIIFRFNGANEITRTALTDSRVGNAANNLRLGRQSNASSFSLVGYVSEILFWATDQAANKIAIENNIASYYNTHTPIWNGNFTGILDTYPNSAAAYSLRNLSSTYKGALIRVRKDTTGQPEQDIYGDYYGNLDTVGLKNFLNARSGFVTTWYDQSGNGRNATQTIQANQPRIALTGTIDRQGTRPTINFIAANSYYFLIPQFSTDTSYSAYMATKRTASNSIAPYLSSRSIAVLVAPWSDNAIWLHYRISTTNATSYAQKKATDNTTTFNLVEAYANISSQSVYRNNTLLTLGSALNFTSNQITWGSIGTYAGLGFFPDGVMSETIIYHSNQLSNRIGIATNINAYYSIY